MSTRTVPSLESVLGSLLGAEVAAVDVVRSPYSTSYPIDELTVLLEDGSQLELVRKDLSWTSLLPAARRTKPAFLYEPRREMLVYTSVLPAAPPGPARCWGVVDQPRAGHRWLFLERLCGVELFQVGDIERWQAAARWIGEAHRHFEGRVEELVPDSVPLLVHDWRWMHRWADRAVAGAGRHSSRALRRLRSSVAVLWARITELPTTFVHGELYASNVIVGPPGPHPRVSPIDWEMAAAAPGLFDLAALTAGEWLPADRRTIEEAYASAAGRRFDDEFQIHLDLCRLALCVQWLGWRPRWRPPPEHRHDWLAEALSLVESLGV